MEPDATVLFVDDERNVLTSLARHLMREPYRKLFANSAREALALLEHEKVQVVCSDIRMPEMDGLEFLQEVRTRHPDIVRLVLSGTPEIQRVVDAINSGAVFRYITKPIDELAEFRAVLRQAFEYHELQQRQADLLIQLREMNKDLERWRKRVAHELDVAGKVQRRMQTTTPLLHDAYEVWWGYRPSLTIGGDFFDAVNWPDGRLCVYLGDVAGHGIGAALVSTLLKVTATDLIKAHPEAGPAGICRMLNQYMRAHRPDEEVYATLFIAIYDPATSTWRACNCGHPRPFLLGPTGECQGNRIPDRGDLPLGLADGETLYAEDVEVMWTATPGETLVLFTDGLCETRHTETGLACGIKHLQNVARSLVIPELPIPLPDDLLARLAAEGFNLADDDCCAAMVRVLPPEESRLKKTAGNLATVDQLASDCEKCLLAAGWPDRQACTVRLLVMEYGVNIVRHGRLPPGTGLDFELRLCGPHAYLLFRDPGMPWDGTAHPAWKKSPFMDAENGRGLAIIQAVATRLEIFRRGDYNYGYFVVARDQQPIPNTDAEAESP